jgi:hypothetical protein
MRESTSSASLFKKKFVRKLTRIHALNAIIKPQKTLWNTLFAADFLPGFPSDVRYRKPAYEKRAADTGIAMRSNHPMMVFAKRIISLK